MQFINHSEVPRMSKMFHFLALVAAATFTTAVNAEHIVDEHIKAIGGADAIANVKTLKRSGTVAMESPFGAFQGSIEESCDIAGEGGHRLLDVAIFVMESGWSEGKGWQDVPQQGMKDMSEQELAMAKMNASVSILASIKKAYGMEVFGEPADKQFNEKDCIELTATIDKRPLKFYLNKETKLLEGIEIYKGEDSEELMLTNYFEDYKTVDGIQMANKSTTKIAQPPITIVNEFATTEVNGELDKTLFAKPEPAEPTAAE